MKRSITLGILLLSTLCSCLSYKQLVFLQELSEDEADSGFVIVEEETQELDSADLDDVERPSYFFFELMMLEDDEITSSTDDQVLDEIFYEEQEDLDADEIFDTESDDAKELEDSFSGELWDV